MLGGGPMMPTPIFYSSGNINMNSTATNWNMYGRILHVEREHPHYRHVPFDWYQPPNEHYNIIHEDTAVVTLNGPGPLGNSHRYYIYDDDDDDDESSSSFESEESDDIHEPSHGQRSTGYQTHFDKYIGDTNRSFKREPMRTTTYTIVQQPTVPLVSSIRSSNY